jgi:hypothetical protein
MVVLLVHFSYCGEPEEACECRFCWRKTALRSDASVYTHTKNAVQDAGGGAAGNLV